MALRDIDDAITRAHAQAESAIATTAAPPAELDLGLPPDRAEARCDSIAALTAWGTSARTTLSAVQASTTAESEQASASLIAVAQSHTEETPEDAKEALELLKVADQAAVRDAAVALAAVEECERRIAERETIEAEATAEREQIALLTALAGDLREDRFGEYIVQETIGLLSARASEELLRISGGRYSLAARGDDFQVIDHHNADEQRSVKTLSGGETFLASLALALALSRHIGELASEGLGAKLESVFIDEGFGTLDPATLEDVIDALERLRADNLVVGVISHVPELAQRIQSGLVVREIDGRSRILRSDEE
jgi:exonuclease SbcC